MTVSVEQLQSELPLLISRVQAGETLQIEQAGRLIGTLIPAPTGMRSLGALEGRGVIPDDIKTPYQDDVEAMFYGE